VQWISYIFDFINIIDKAASILVHSRKCFPPNLIIFIISKLIFRGDLKYDEKD
jgi:hypothetical protein